MKKLLALVLTLVMTMSLMTVSNAATFSDDANIDYKEAVEVMAAVGVLAGDGTGAFDADGELTRAAAAKIVTYLMIGAEAAEGLTVSAAPYADVPADHWAAGYIAYLAGEGVVGGGKSEGESHTLFAGADGIGTEDVEQIHGEKVFTALHNCLLHGGAGDALVHYQGQVTLFGCELGQGNVGKGGAG